MLKICKKCQEEKDLTLFHKNRKDEDGHESICKQCRSLYQKDLYKRKWFAKTAALKKSYCKLRGLPFNLTGDYLESIWTDCCPVLGIKLERHSKEKDSCPAIDRIDPKKGYTKGNVRYISARANRIKYDASVEELKKVLPYVEGATTIPNGSTLK